MDTGPPLNPRLLRAVTIISRGTLHLFQEMVLVNNQPLRLLRADGDRSVFKGYSGIWGRFQTPGHTFEAFISEAVKHDEL